MRIHGLCLVKNEGDIIRQGLESARTWCDAIYVLDNGSTDATWDIVRALAAADPAIVAWKQSAVPFRDGLRAEIYHAFADRAEAGDWWARLDPDELYIDDPKAFLTSVPEGDGCVWYAPLNYYFSTEEARRYREDPSQFGDDVPITDKCRHYFNHWSEPRFVRHEAMDPWRGDDGWPEDLLDRVKSHQKRILCRHFQYRSPAQIERRIATRAASALSGNVFPHEALKNWRAVNDPAAIRVHRWKDLDHAARSEQLDSHWESRLMDAGKLVFDAHDGHFVLNEDLMPPIPPKPLVLRRLFRNLIKNKYTRFARQLVKEGWGGRPAPRS